MSRENGQYLEPSESGAVILVLEDHDQYRDVVCRALESYVENVRTVGVGSVAMALELLHDRNIDLMVADMTLPDGTALDLLANAQQHVGRGMKVVLFSNYSSVEMHPLLMRPDVHAVLTKEQGLRDLAKAVRSALSEMPKAAAPISVDGCPV